MISWFGESGRQYTYCLLRHFQCVPTMGSPITILVSSKLLSAKTMPLLWPIKEVAEVTYLYLYEKFYMECTKITFSNNNILDIERSCYQSCQENHLHSNKVYLLAKTLSLKLWKLEYNMLLKANDEENLWHKWTHIPRPLQLLKRQVYRLNS